MDNSDILYAKADMYTKHGIFHPYNMQAFITKFYDLDDPVEEVELTIKTAEEVKKEKLPQFYFPYCKKLESWRLCLK